MAGSPPRVRGKPVWPDALILHGRITPAFAGKTYDTRQRAWVQKDHPRVCGENRASLETRVLTMGSPPRVRGKQSPPSFPCVSLRITPACAGKTTCASWYHNAPGDHPRVCGENAWRCTRFGRDRGSPPRVRGKQPARDYVFASPRITPACAGKTRPQRSVARSAEDHPRVCGENDF